MYRGKFLIALLFPFFAIVSWQARSETFPDDSGAINVRSYGAVGDGRHDDTSALLRAIAASGPDTGPLFWKNRIVYFPQGTYLVSGTLLKRYANGQFASGMMLVGESRDNTTIRLIDHAPGFANGQRKTPVIFTASKLLAGSATAGGKDYSLLGEGNDAYMNFVEDMTIDVGSGNPGAVAVDFLANNIGAIRNVTLRAPPNSGAVGLSMTRKWPGPALIQNLTVIGFDTGIDIAHTQYGLTFDHVRLIGQRVIGLHNHQNALSIYGLEISGPAPLISNSGEKGFLAIDKGLLTTVGSPVEAKSAILNAGIITARSLRIESLENGRRQSAGSFDGVLAARDQWRGLVRESWLASVADSPPPFDIPIKHWVNVATFGAAGDAQDATESLRLALQSGAAVIYLPHGTYNISDTLEVPASVQRIIGMNSTIHVFKDRLDLFPNSRPMIRVAADGAPLTIEKLHFDHTDLGTKVAIEISGARDVTVRDAVSAGVTIVDRKADGGRVFLENSCCGKLRTTGARPVFARQLDTEGGGVRILNVGSPLWILGLKTEGVSTIVENREGARTDLFGGLVYMVRDHADKAVPAFVNSGSWFHAAFVEESLRAASRYRTYIAQQLPNGVETIDATQFPARGFGRFVPSLTVTPLQRNAQ